MGAPPRAAGFTLIELLIVVAIISILSSIAVPNFLEAQTRAKVGRAKADMASLGTALEIYAVDHNGYPMRRDPGEEWVPPMDTKMDDMHVLSTPVRYISTIPEDIFDKDVAPPLNVLNYFDPEQTRRFARQKRPKGELSADLWLLLSVGPDSSIGVKSSGFPGGYPVPPGANLSILHEYDPSNGTISTGNIYRLQGGAGFYQTIWGI